MTGVQTCALPIPHDHAKDSIDATVAVEEEQGDEEQPSWNDGDGEEDGLVSVPSSSSSTSHQNQTVSRVSDEHRVLVRMDISEFLLPFLSVTHGTVAV